MNTIYMGTDPNELAAMHAGDMASDVEEHDDGIEIGVTDLVFVQGFGLVPKPTMYPDEIEQGIMRAQWKARTQKSESECEFNDGVHKYDNGIEEGFGFRRCTRCGAEEL